MGQIVKIPKREWHTREIATAQINLEMLGFEIKGSYEIVMGTHDPKDEEYWAVVLPEGCEFEELKAQAWDARISDTTGPVLLIAHNPQDHAYHSNLMAH